MHRNTIYAEDAEVLARCDEPEGQCILRLKAPQCARAARPGQFVHIQCCRELLMRRPYSIMRADAEAGWIEILFNLVGEGSRRLAGRNMGERASCLGPIGRPLSLSPGHDAPLLLGGGVGIPPIVFFAESLVQGKSTVRTPPRVMLASERPFPFRTHRANETFTGLLKEADLSCARLQKKGVPSLLVSRRGFAGCFNGYIHEAADAWLEARPVNELSRIGIFACGPEPMLRAAAELAGRYNLPCQLVVEEYMAFGVGGCAGCVIPVHRGGERVMQRVCVDGPVFDAAEIYPGCFT